MTPRVLVAAHLVAALAVGSPALAQGKGKGPKSTPPSRTTLPTPTISSPSAAGALPFAWIDDATVLPSRVVEGSLSIVDWTGDGASETDVPVVGLAVGVTPRVQIGASIPHVIGGNDPTEAAGGLGTTFIDAKILVLSDRRSGLKAAVAPALEILGAGAVQPGESRTHVGLPASIELDRGVVRLFGGAGYFSNHVWFAGGGLWAQLTPRTALSGSFSRAWASDAGTIVHDRRDLSGGVAYTLTPRLLLFGSIGTTVATSSLDGAGTTAAGGVVVVLAPASSKK